MLDFPFKVERECRLGRGVVSVGGPVSNKKNALSDGSMNDLLIRMSTLRSLL